MIIKENLKHSEEPKHETCEFQATTGKTLVKIRTFAVPAIYCPPRCMLETGDYLRLFQSLGNRFIIGRNFKTYSVGAY